MPPLTLKRSSHSAFSLHGSQRTGLKCKHLTFTLVLIPGVDAILHAIAHQRVVYAHVAVTEEGICFTRSWRETRERETNEHHSYHTGSV